MEMNDLTTQFQNNQMQAGNFSGGMMAQASREMEEVKGQIFMAKQFPRNAMQAEARILDACKRKSLAESAIYSYPRGGQRVSGPSIRLAEVVAQNWGNISFGIKELKQENGESEVMAYAWDLETNVRQEKIFTVKHERHTKKGVNYLTDSRDIYELVANNGARRLRSCILAIIPGDIIDNAVLECEKTLTNQNDRPLADRLKEAFKLFKENYDVTQDMIEARFGYKTSAFTERNLIDLGGIYRSLKDGMSKVEDWFERPNHAEKAEKEDKNELEKEFAAKKESKSAEPTIDDVVNEALKEDEAHEVEQTELL